MEEPGAGWQGARRLNWGSTLVPHMQSRPTMRMVVVMMVVETITIMIRMMAVAMITTIDKDDGDDNDHSKTFCQ